MVMRQRVASEWMMTPPCGKRMQCCWIAPAYSHIHTIPTHTLAHSYVWAVTQSLITITRVPFAMWRILHRAHCVRNSRVFAICANGTMCSILQDGLCENRKVFAQRKIIQKFDVCRCVHGDVRTNEYFSVESIDRIFQSESCEMHHGCFFFQHVVEILIEIRIKEFLCCNPQ